MDDTGPPSGPRRRLPTQRFVAAVLVAMAMVGALFAQQESSSQSPLADVRIAGNRTIPTPAILKHIKSREGRPVSGATISEDVQELYRTRWFISVAPRVEQGENGPELIFEVIERPVVEKIEYRGNEEIDDEHLAALTGLKKGSPYDPHTNVEAARRMENHYKEEGYTFANVTLISGSEADQRNVIFQIKEGQKVRVKDVVFDGNTGWTIASGLADANLRMKLQTERMFPIIPGMLSLPLGGLYKPETIPNDIANLKSYYHSLGFFDVQITHKKLFNEDKSRVVIKYNIDQGTRYQVTDIDYQGNRVCDVEELAAERELEPGELFNEKALKQDLAHMKDIYGELGRLFSSVDPVLQYSETPGKVSLIYRIDEDRPIYVRSVNTELRGDHPHTKGTLLRNMSQIHPGDLADPDLIRRTKQRIGGSGIFERGGADGVSIDIERVGFETGESVPLIDDEPKFRGQSPDDYRTSNPFLPPRQTAAPAGNPYVAATGYAAPSRQSVRKTAPVYLPPVQERASASTTPAGQAVIPAGATFPQPTTVSGPSPFAGPVTPRTLPVQTADGVVNPYVQQPVIQPLAGQVGDYTPPFVPSSPQGDPLADYYQQPGYIDLNIAATEARTGRLMIGAGVNSNSGLVGNIVFSEDNFDILRFPRSPRDLWNGTAFRGAGQKFRIEAVPGNVVSRYLVSWTDPYFLDTVYSVGTSGFYFQRYYPDWNEERAGGRFTLGRQLTRNLSVNGIVRAEAVEIWDPTFPTPQILQDALGDSTLITAGAGLTWDNRDSALLPSEGQIVEFTYTQGITDYQYPRFDLEATQYYTLFSRPDGTGKHIFSLGGIFGWTGDDTPIFERFYAGGFQSLRGFEFRGVGPREMGVNIGGQFLLAGSVQYMFPLLANDALHGVVFSDFGTVNKDISVDNFRASVGTGLRISIPAFGPAPLAFDFAFPVAKVDGDETQIFSFYIGVQR